MAIRAPSELKSNMTELTLGWPNQPWLPELLPDLKSTSSQEMFDEKNPVGIFSIIFHIDLNKIFRHRPLMVCLKRQVHIDLNNLFKHRPLPHFYQIPNCLKIFKRPTSPASPRTRIPCSSLPLPHPHWPPCNTNFVLPHIIYIYNISRN